jgi:membrane-bound lytic murein transglycosylase D
LNSTAHDVPIPLNPKVLAYVDLFQGRLRDWFQTSLQRSAPYLPMIQARLRAEGLPLDLAYVPIVESAFRTDALSRAKAKGFWQLMRGTAVEQGLQYDWYIDERSNPEKSTAAAAKYLKLLNRMFDGDWHLALASYNGGPGTVQRAVKRKGGEADFWPLAASRRYLPRETREYVPMVLASIVIARNPEHYGFDFTPAEPPPIDKVTLPGPVDLRRVAEWAGVPIDEVQRLNPELRRWTTPLRGTSFELAVPAGAGPLVEQRLSELPADEFTALQWHTVRKGESLQSVANKLKVRRTDLAEANYLSTRARLKPGQRLVIPRAPTTLLAVQSDRPEPVLAKARSSPAESAVVDSVASKPSIEPSRVTYRVKRGDTLSSIARLFGTTVASLRSWNGLKSDRLMPGDRLTVYTTRSVPD